jgi:Raf kinase inhibitor-like YbhB/YbcL family protein
MPRSFRYLFTAALLCALGSGCFNEEPPEGMESTIGPVAEAREQARKREGKPMPPLTVKSPVIDENGAIPVKYTCDGRNVSPPLDWGGVPKGTRSVLLMVEDPGAPSGIFTHWIFYNIPPDITSLQEDVEPGESIGSVAGAADIATGQATNDFNDIGYSGPCPPEGKSHQYVFRVIALDRDLRLDSSSRHDAVMRAIEGHVLAEGQLTANYRRGGEEPEAEEE